MEKIGSVTRKISKSTLRKKHKMTCLCPFLITSLVKMKQVIKTFILLYRVVRQWWIIRKFTGNLQKPPENRIFLLIKKIDKKVYIKKNPETCQILTGNRRSPFLEVSGGFWRFPEVSRGFRRFVEVFGGFWRFPEVSGGFWIPSTLEFQAEHSKFDRFSSKINLTLHILLSIKEK